MKMTSFFCAILFVFFTGILEVKAESRAVPKPKNTDIEKVLIHPVTGTLIRVTIKKTIPLVINFVLDASGKWVPEMLSGGSIASVEMASISATTVALTITGVAATAIVVYLVWQNREWIVENLNELGDFTIDVAKTAWDGTKWVAQATWDGVKWMSIATVEGSKEFAVVAWEGSKLVTQKTWNGTKWVAQETWDGMKWISAMTVDGSKEFAIATWDGTKWVAQETWDGTQWLGNVTKNAAAQSWLETKNLSNRLWNKANILFLGTE